MQRFLWLTCLCAALAFALPVLTVPPAMAAGQAPEAANGESIAEGSYKPLGIYIAPKIGMSLMRFRGRSMGFDTVPGTGTVQILSASMNGKDDEVFGGGISLGYDFAPRLNIPVRLELDYTTRSEVEITGSVSVPRGAGITYEGTQKDKIALETLLLNAWFDIPTGTAFSPYLGGGIGWAFISHKGSHAGEYVYSTLGPPDPTYSGSGSSREKNFAWSLGGGLAYDFTPCVSLDLGYRYIHAEHSSTNMSGYDKPNARQRSFKSKVDIKSHDIMLGLRITF
ncbi:outer membrane beta-barrel protein [Desulfovibrio sp. OttesenSCG-928-G11]|nr:outer membrane beta-barrel protein [Desulfovibrio sp. OttesenSCG-928-G11]